LTHSLLFTYLGSAYIAISSFYNFSRSLSNKSSI